MTMVIFRQALAKLRQQRDLWANWVVRFWDWLWVEPEITRALLATVLALALALSLPSCWEARIRFTGMVLELLGVFVVALGLRHTRELFEQPTLLKSIRGWLREFPPLRRHVRLVAGAARIAVQGGKAYGLITIKPRPGEPLDERVTSLEMNLNQVFKFVHELERRFDRTTEKHDTRLEAERQAREEGDKGAHDRIYQAVASGLHMEWLGVAFLVFGIALATMSQEIASLLGVAACVGTFSR